MSRPRQTFRNAGSPVGHPGVSRRTRTLPATPARRRTRRGFLTAQASGTAGHEAPSPAEYEAWIAQYRSGRFVETARRLSNHQASDLREVQSAFVDSLPPAEVASGFWGRIAAALLHAEDLAQTGWGASTHPRLIRDPLRSLPGHWPGAVSALHRDAARTAWGDEAASNPRELFFRETILAVARLRLARLDLAAASRILELAEPRRDAALRWQLAAVWTVRARFTREEDLWPKVRDLLADAASRRFLDSAEGRSSSRLAARALADPDDRNLRLAVALIGMGRRQEAADRLARVSERPAPRLQVPRLLLEAEAHRFRGQLPRATVLLREASLLAPDSQVVIAALVAALQAAGLWDEAAALANDRLRAGERTLPWADFLLTWASTDEPALDWLRSLVRG